jgi:hypothetical protein
MDPWRQLSGGDPLPRSAAVYNAMLRAAKDARGHDADKLVDSIRQTPQSTIVPILNGTADPVAKFGVLGIERPNFLPSSNAQEFNRRVHLRGVAPEADYLGAFAVLLEPLAPGAIGKGVVSGVVPCRVYFPEGDPRYGFADLYTEEPKAALIAQGYGPAQILWIDDEISEEDGALCIVRLGNDTRGVHFDVRCTIDGGTSGTLTSTCSWTYTVTNEAGGPLGATMTPKKRRLVNTPYSSTPAGTEGSGYYNALGQFVLFDANETPLTGPDCPEDP